MKQLLCKLSILLFFSSCAIVKSYEKQFVNDSEMQMGNDPGKNFNDYVHSIREGATPAGTTETSGGCGCK
jgi:Domain of unknown function (DUF4266)